MSHGDTARAAEFAYSIAIPRASKCYRIPEVFTTTPSALAQPYRIQTATWTATQPTGPSGRNVILPDGEMFAAISRSPIHSLVQYVRNDLGATYFAEARFPPNPRVPAGAGPGLVTRQYEHITLIPSAGVTTGANLTYSTLQDLGPSWGSTFHPHGDQFYAGEHLGRRGFWCPGNSQNGAPIGSSVSTFQFTVELFNVSSAFPVEQRVTITSWYSPDNSEWTAGGDVSGTMPPGAGGSMILALPCPFSGYYAHDYVVEIKSSPVGPTVEAEFAVQVRYQSNLATMGHSPVPGLSIKNAAIGAIRPISSAVMLSPNAALYQRQGLVRGVQLPIGLPWSTAYRGGFDTLSTAEGAYNGTWNDGIYGFLKPSDFLEFKMFSPFKTNTTSAVEDAVVVDVTYPLFPPGSWAVIHAKVDSQALVGDPVYSAGVSYLTHSVCLEFRTLDTWFHPDVPMLDQRELEAAMRMVAGMPQFTENPFHFAAAAKFIAGAINKVVPFIPSIAGALLGTSKRGKRMMGEANATHEAMRAGRTRKEKKPKERKVRVPAPRRSREEVRAPPTPRRASIASAASRRGSEKKSTTHRKKGGLDMFLESRKR